MNNFLTHSLFLPCLYLFYILLWLFVGFLIYRLHKWLSYVPGYLYEETGDKTETPYRFYKWAPWVMLVISLYWVTFLILAAVWLVPVIYAGFSSLPVKG